MSWKKQPYGTAVCGYCGFTVVTLDVEARLTYCPRCSEKTLIDECPHCRGDIQIMVGRDQPEQCLSCGGYFSVWGAQRLQAQSPDGTIQPYFVPEPTAQEREAYTKNYPNMNWLDALRENQKRQQEAVTAMDPGEAMRRIFHMPPPQEQEEEDED